MSSLISRAISYSIFPCSGDADRTRTAENFIAYSDRALPQMLRMSTGYSASRVNGFHPTYHPLDLNLSRFLFRLREIISRLYPQPRLRAAAEGLVQPYRHFRRNTCPAPNEAVHCLARHAKCVCPVRHGQPNGSRQSWSTDNPGWGRFFIRIVSLLLADSNISFHPLIDKCRPA
jgi:hypothetical protein